MRLKLFDTIDEALALLEENNAFYHEVEKDIRKALKDLFANKTEMIVDVNSRVKSKESLREKIIRNRFYVDYQNAQDILDNLSDLIGFIIECRFIEDEYKVLNIIRERMNVRNEDDGYYCNEAHPLFYLDCASRQPQIQKMDLPSIALTVTISKWCEGEYGIADKSTGTFLLGRN